MVGFASRILKFIGSREVRLGTGHLTSILSNRINRHTDQCGKACSSTGVADKTYGSPDTSARLYPHNPFDAAADDSLITAHLKWNRFAWMASKERTRQGSYAA